MRTTDTIGIAIVGAGFAANLQARVFGELVGLDVELVGITSRTQARPMELARRCGIREVLPDYASLLALKDVDIVDLCIPNYIHREFAVQAAQAGNHVICEKPLTGCFGREEEIVARIPRRKMLESPVPRSQGDLSHWLARALYRTTLDACPAGVLLLMRNLSEEPGFSIWTIAILRSQTPPPVSTSPSG